MRARGGARRAPCASPRRRSPGSCAEDADADDDADDDSDDDRRRRRRDDRRRGPTQPAPAESAGTRRPAPADRTKSSCVATPTASRPGRTIAALAVLIALVFGLICVAAPDSIGDDELLARRRSTAAARSGPRGRHQRDPHAAGGERATGKITSDALDQAVTIIRSRVDSFGVAEAEVTTAGNNIVISVPGKQDKTILRHGAADRRAAVPPRAARGCRRRRRRPRRRVRRRPAVRLGHGLAVAVPSAHRPRRARRPTSRTVPAALPGRPRRAPSASRRPAPAHRRPTATATPRPATGRHPRRRSRPAELQQEFADARLQRPEEQVQPGAARPGADRPKKPLVTCDRGRRREVHPRPGRGARHRVSRRPAPASSTNRPGRADRRLGGQPHFTGDGTQEVRRRHPRAGRPDRRPQPVRASSWTDWSSPRRPPTSRSPTATRRSPATSPRTRRTTWPTC